MAKVIDFSRFRPPDHRDEPQIIAECPCGNEIYEGDTVFMYDQAVHCSETCAVECAGIEMRENITREDV